jgi:hypothetical protein
MWRGYMCMYSVVLFVCNSSTVVQYNSVTRPPLSVMHRLSEAKWDVLAQCLCSVGTGEGRWRKQDTYSWSDEEAIVFNVSYHTARVHQPVQ